MGERHDTFDRRIQLGASRRRYEDATVLQERERWAGAMYMAGYAIECSLKALICYYEGKSSFKDTRLYNNDERTNSLHNLTLLLGELTVLQRVISLDKTGKYIDAWNIVTRFWRKDELRYWDKQGYKDECLRFVKAVKLLHTLILRQQGEAS